VRIRFSGLGGQGVVVSGVIYGHAGMLEGHNVLQRQSYGSTTRGGVTTSDVTLAEGEIHELEAPEFDALVALCQEAHDRFRPLLRPGGVLLTERSLVDAQVDPGIRHFAVPAVERARDGLGRQILANIVIVGAVSAVLPDVGVESLRRAITANVPAGTADLNIRAFELGRDAVLEG
jgi:2-oxoglutarate ferredoxin oxidoreductase subunit gamma